MRLLSGQRAFLVQRLTAIVMLAYLGAGALLLALGPEVTFAQWQSWSARPLAATALLVLALALLVHAWVGIRDVVLDYVHPLKMRLMMLGGVASGLVVLAIWVAAILIRNMIAFA